MSTSPNYDIKFNSLKIMGILNITQDSFSDGNKFFNKQTALNQALKMIADGADIIDIGGESTRPGASPISDEEEIERVIPIIEKLRSDSEILISIDTYKPMVALEALKAGANIVNDITALRHESDLKMTDVLYQFPLSRIIMMHMQGTPQTMQDNPVYKDVVEDIISFFYERINFCQSYKIDLDRIILDPGIGFGKIFEHNIKIIKNIHRFQNISPKFKQSFPVLLGASRKSFINNIYESKANERLIGSLATTVSAYLNNIQIIRVHDVKEHKQLLKSLKWML